MNLLQASKDAKYSSGESSASDKNSDIDTSDSDWNQSDSDLSDFEDDWLFSKNQGHSKLSISDHAATILGFCLRHNLSGECVNDLLKLIKLHLPDDNFCLSSFGQIKEKVTGLEAEKYEFIEYCEICYSIWPEDESVTDCPKDMCRGKRYCGKKKKCYILTSSIENQLKAVLNRPGMWQKIADRIKDRGKDQGYYSDVMDGKKYLELCAEGGVLFNSTNLTLILNTDGVALYKSSRIELWPVYVAINEIPAIERFQCRNVALWGIWQGRGKPPVFTFFKPFTEALSKLAFKGITLDNQVHVKLYTVLSSMDLIAKAPFLNMNQHNGYSGCATCLIEGKHVNNVHVYPYEEWKKVELRTDAGFLADAKIAVQTKKKVNGIKGPSYLMTLPVFSICDGTVPDYMHGILLGVVKRILCLWFNPTEHKKYYKQYREYPDYYIGSMVNDVDRRLQNMKPLDVISRRPRCLSGNLAHLKANEFRAWLLYYSLPSLKDILPEVYWTHFALLVESIHILLGDTITNEDLDWSKKCLQLFYKYFTVFYCDSKCGLNVHNLAHLPLFVENWGPLWNWSCFGFESLNGTLMKQVHGTKNACSQVFKAFNGLKTIYSMINLSTTKEPVKELLQSMLINNRKNASTWTRVSEDCFLGGNSEVSSGERFKRFNLLKWKKTCYTSVSYRRATKTVNYVVTYIKENGHQSFAQIQYYLLVENETVLFCGKEIEREASWKMVKNWERSRIIRVQKESNNNLFIAPVTSLLHKLFYIDGNSDFICVCKIPNIVEGD